MFHPLTLLESVVELLRAGAFTDDMKRLLRDALGEPPRVEEPTVPTPDPTALLAEEEVAAGKAGLASFRQLSELNLTLEEMRGVLTARKMQGYLDRANADARDMHASGYGGVVPAGQVEAWAKKQGVTIEGANIEE